MADRLVSDESGVGGPRRAGRRFRPSLNDRLETRVVPAAPAAAAAVAVAPAARPRGASAPVGLDGWNSQAAWQWMEGRWSLVGDVLGRTVPVPGGIRFSVGPDGVRDVPGAATPSAALSELTGALPFVTFGPDGAPSLTMSSVTPGQPPAVLRAVSATRTSVTFAGNVDPANDPGATPVVLRATLKRSGPSAFRIDADAQFGPVPMHVLTYKARKLPG